MKNLTISSLVILAIAIMLITVGCKVKTTPDNTGLPNPASVNCVDKGGKLEIITDANGAQFGICKLADGNVCEEWDYFKGDCPKKTPAECGTCPQFSPPGPGFCPDGKIVDGGKDVCGCQMPPKCDMGNIACTEEAKLCPDGSAVGRVGPNCEFAACPVGTPNPSIEKNFCTDQRRAEICTKIGHPVCGWFDQSIKCFAYPCAQDFGNPCMACKNENVDYWTEGECPKVGSKP
jgi:putative hemolysin